MNKILFDKVKSTISNYDIDINDDNDIIKLIYDLMPVYKNYFLSMLPTIKEIENDCANQPKINSFTIGIANGASNIIEKFKKL